MKQVYLLFSLLFLVTVAAAQDAEEINTDPVATEAEESEATEKSPLEISGMADIYYQYAFNGQASGNTSFTPDHNSFSLGMAKLALAKEFGKVGLGVDVGFGPRADAANGSLGTSFAQIQQLFVTYSPIENLTFTAGNFGTHVGYELIDPAANFHYSTSYMFSYGPFFHTGIKADYAINDKLGVMVGLFDDTDSKSDDAASGAIADRKHFGAQVSYATGAGDIYLNYLTGTDGVDTVTFNQIDLTAAFDLSDKLTLGVNSTVKALSSDNESIEGTNWFGAALYLGYAVNDNFSLGLRGESFNDTDGVIFGVEDLSIFATTLSANIKIGELTLIPEFRLDSASEDIFEDVTGDVSASTGTDASFIFAAVYAF